MLLFVLPCSVVPASDVSLSGYVYDPLLSCCVSHFIIYVLSRTCVLALYALLFVHVLLCK